MRRPETIRKEIERLEQKRFERVGQGRTRGGGAGGFNRDVDAIVHRLRLLRDELGEAERAD